MLLGQLLVANGLVSQEDVAAGLRYQRQNGGRIGEILVAMGRLSREDLVAVLASVPPAPQSVADTGIALSELIDLLTKTMLAGGVDTVARVAEEMHLPPRVAHQLVDEAKERQLLEALGSTTGGLVLTPRYGLSARGRDWAYQAQEKNGYVGPTPVPLGDYVSRIRLQAIGGERVTPEQVAAAMAGIIVPEALTGQVGPAINSGRAMLLYGPPGNGKTSVAQRIGGIFAATVYVPFAFEVGGQVIKVFDPDIHREVPPPEGSGPVPGNTIRARGLDPRWVPCSRPFVVTGGELTLEMLDLSYNAQARFYEAPLHVKALNGAFLIDDFGRQLARPETLLNRWIVPMESRVDYLKLHTGKSFTLPFDCLVMFSTNMPPSQLMDAAFLRRIPYKVEVPAPDRDTFRRIFHEAAAVHGLEAPEEAIGFVMAEIADRRGQPLAAFQPNFLLEQVVARARYLGIPARVEEAMLRPAIENLHTRD